jgi:hypothetical protein
VAHAAHPDYDRGAARPGEVCQLVHRVVGGDAGVGVRRQLGGIRSPRELHDRALGHEDVVREPAVHGQAGELVALAMHVLAPPAGHAESAAVRRVQHDAVTGCHCHHVIAGGLDPSGILVSEHERRRDPRRLHLAVDCVQVGGTDAGSRDLDEHVVRALGLGGRPLGELERAVVLGEERDPQR